MSLIGYSDQKQVTVIINRLEIFKSIIPTNLDEEFHSNV